jgi:virginiamycin B lyase
MPYRLFRRHQRSRRDHSHWLKQLGTLTGGVLVAALTAPTVLVNALGASPTITEYPIPSFDSFPPGIVAGPDGALWFTELNGNQIGRIPTTATPANPQITEFMLPYPDSQPIEIAAGPDGALWFTEQTGNKIGRIPTNATPANPQISEYKLPSPGSQPAGIAAGPDGALWFTEQTGNKIGRIPTTATPTSPQITEYTITTDASQPFGIATGPDEALWFTEQAGNKIGRITPETHAFSEYPISIPLSQPFGIAAGPDRALWFTAVGNIGRITVGSNPTITEYPIPTPTPSALPDGIAAGPDRAMWFTVEGSGNSIGRITTDSSHTVTEYPVPTAASNPFWIAAGPDLAMWFTESLGNKIGRITVPCDERDGEGDIQGVHKTNQAHFVMDQDRCKDGDPELVTMHDPDSGTNFTSTRIDSVSFDTTANALTITGIGVDNGLPVTFNVVAVDLGSTALDTFSIVLSDGYQNAGPLLSGSITLH